jgi:aspartyl/asparaginyl beta-hydroxylase (cupin superfamily)
MNAPDITRLRQSGAEALRRGDMQRARESFEHLVAAGQADINVYLALAGSCGRLDDFPAAHAAADKALSIDSRNLRALIVKGDLLAHDGDPRAASAFYTTALRIAPPAQQLTADLRADLERVNATCQRYAQQFEATLLGKLAQVGYAGRASTARFSQSLDLLFGRKEIYFQQPGYFYFPELPQVQFYPRATFPWIEQLEAATPDIRAELLHVLEDASGFKPYVQSDPGRPRNPDDTMLDNPDWSAFYLWKDGEVIAENAARCPRTLAALEGVPFPRIRGRSPSILFSLLKPGAHIPAHNGFVNTRLICHLPLIVPPGCHFRVGNDVREWREGQAWLFDDTIQHEAWNRSDRTRVILLFETWRPELTPEERELVRTLFEAIDAEGGQKPAWSI